MIPLLAQVVVAPGGAWSFGGLLIAVGSLDTMRILKGRRSVA